MSPDQAAWPKRYLEHLSLERRLATLTVANYRRDLEVCQSEEE